MNLSLAARRALFWILFFAVTYLTLVPKPPDDGSGFDLMRAVSVLLFDQAVYADKVAHFTAYAGLAGAGVLAELARRRGVLFAGLLIIWGMLLEGAQRLGGMRTGEWGDIIANGLGVISGMVAGYVLLAAMNLVMSKFKG